MHSRCYHLHNIHIHTDCFTVSNFSKNMHIVVNNKFCHRNPNKAAWFPIRSCQDDCWNEKGFETKRLCPTFLRSEVPPTCQSVLTGPHSHSGQPVYLPRFEPDSSWIHFQNLADTLSWTAKVVWIFTACAHLHYFHKKKTHCIWLSFVNLYPTNVENWASS
jgi:hypothetical protein